MRPRVSVGPHCIYNDTRHYITFARLACTTHLIVRLYAVRLRSCVPRAHPRTRRDAILPCGDHGHSEVKETPSFLHSVSKASS